ncbi:hypothetical protein AAHE18_08G204000 [Arachis hypogaea]
MDIVVDKNIAVYIIVVVMMGTCMVDMDMVGMHIAMDIVVVIAEVVILVEVVALLQHAWRAAGDHQIYQYTSPCTDRMIDSCRHVNLSRRTQNCYSIMRSICYVLLPNSCFFGLANTILCDTLNFIAYTRGVLIKAKLSSNLVNWMPLHSTQSILEAQLYSIDLHYH